MGKEETHELYKRIGQMESFFEKQSQPIKQKCIKRMVRTFRKLGRESEDVKFIGDDYSHLNLFEQISLVAMPGDLHLYPHVMDTIYNFAKDEYMQLTDDEKFILNHQGLDDDFYIYCPIEDIKSDFIKYATDYKNEKLAVYR